MSKSKNRKNHKQKVANRNQRIREINNKIKKFNDVIYQKILSEMKSGAFDDENVIPLEDGGAEDDYIDDAGIAKALEEGGLDNIDIHVI